MIELDISDIELTLRKEGGKTLVFDPVRKSWLILTPEEHVRQYLIKLMHEKMHYPLALMAVEKQVAVGDMMKRFDIVVYERKEHKPWMLAECKAPDVPISKHTLHQLLNYQRVMRCRYWLLSNGHQTLCADACSPDEIKWLDALPAYNM